MAVKQLSDGNPDGTVLGQSATDLISFYNGTPAAQPSGVAQTAVTDGSGGTANAATGVAAAAYQQTIKIDRQLANLANGQTLKIALPYAFNLVSVGWRTGTVVSTGSKAASLQAQVNGVACTGGAISLTSSNQATSGALTAGSAITAGGAGTAGQTVELAVSGVTAFVEGDGWAELTVTNTSLANAAATVIRLENALQSALVALGAIKGSA